jgi:hypothetical protein
MNKTAPDSDESQMHLEAMLYLLNDPVLDRQAFEARLLNEPQLGEVLANAVDFFHGLQSVEFESNPKEGSDVARLALSDSSSLQWLFFPVLAASLFLACFVSWQAFDLMQTANSNPASRVSLNSVVLAWGDLQLESEEPVSVQETSDGDLASSSSDTDFFAETEVPDWLVLAATDTSENNSTGDGKVFLQ